MIAPYPRRLITEQANRAQALEEMTPCSQTHPVLENLAAECRARLAQQGQLLASAVAALGNAGEDGAVAAPRILKICSRGMDIVEGHCMPPLQCQSEGGRFLNRVLFMMHREVGLEFPCPAASCTSNEYYFSHAQTNAVFAPPSEAEFLPHMPDFYHELGHHLYCRAAASASSPPVSGVHRAAGTIDGHYKGLKGAKKPVGAPASTRAESERLRLQWKDAWIEEAFCDLFALFAAGPACAWANLHLVSRLAPEIYRLDAFARQDHPSNEARMRMLDMGLAMLGHEHEAARIRELWGAMEPAYGAPAPEHGRAFPDDLLGAITRAVLGALRQSGFRGYSGAPPGPGGAGGIGVSGVLNCACRSFWDKETDGYREAEKSAIARLAAAGNGSGGGQA